MEQGNVFAVILIKNLQEKLLNRYMQGVLGDIVGFKPRRQTKCILKERITSREDTRVWGNVDVYMIYI